MLKGLIKLWLKIFYGLDCQGIKIKSRDNQPFLVICPWTSEMDPLLCKLYLETSHPKRVLAPLQKIRTKWILKFIQPALDLPVFSHTAPLFYRKRLQKVLEKGIQTSEDILLMVEGRRNPLIEMVMQKTPFHRVILAHIQRMGSPLSFQKLVPRRKWAEFFLPRKKVEITFIDLSDRLTPDTKPEEIYEILSSALQAENILPEEKKSSQTDLMPIKAEIARLSRRHFSSIDPSLDLYEDLGLDSLDVTELVVFLEQRYQRQVPFAALETVEDVLKAALGFQKPIIAKTILEHKGLQRWDQRRPEVKAPEGKTIPEAFLRTCERMGDALACVDHQEVFSYTRIKSLALGIAGRLKRIPGERIGILLPPSGEMYSIILGLLLAQKTLVMLNATLGPKHLDEVIQSAGLKAILTTSQVMEHLAWEISDELHEKIVLLEDVRNQLTFRERKEGLHLARKTPDELMSLFNLNRLSGEETAVILFTSGTEKSPKGVPLTHQNLLSNHRDICEAVSFKEEDVLLGILPAFHVYGFSMTGLFPLLTGLRALFHPSPLDLQGIAHQVEKWKVTVIATAPTFLKHFVSVATAGQLSSVRLFIIGAEKTPLDLIPLIQQKVPGARFLEGYGLTECSPVLTLNPDVQGNNCVGHPLRHVQILIIDPEHHKPMPSGQQGLIIVRGPNVFGGYLQADQQPFIQLAGARWFMTNDLGFKDSSGQLYLVGRMSRTVKIGGEMISLSFVEDLLLKELPSLQIAIMGEDDARKGTHLILYTTQNLSVEEVNRLLHENGGSNLLKIREVRVISAFPLTGLGKIDYQKLKRLNREI